MCLQVILTSYVCLHSTCLSTECCRYTVLICRMLQTYNVYLQNVADVVFIYRMLHTYNVYLQNVADVQCLSAECCRRTMFIYRMLQTYSAYLQNVSDICTMFIYRMFQMYNNTILSVDIPTRLWTTSQTLYTVYSPSLVSKLL